MTNMNDQEASTPPLALRLRVWGLVRIAKYRDSGQLDTSAALSALQADERYYLDAASESDAAGVWRKMAAILGDRTRPPAETAFVTATFCDDALNAGWDCSQLDRAAEAWRLTGERFVPTFGQLAACASAAAVRSGRVHLSAIRQIVNPAPTQRLPALEPKEKIGDAGMDMDQTLAMITKMEREKAANRIERRGGKSREWGRHDETMLRGLYTRRDSFKEGAA